MYKIRLAALIVVSSSLLGSCSAIDKVEEIFNFTEEKIEQKVTEEKEVSITCNRGDIKDLIDKGWNIVESQEKQVPCTWKTKKANRGCNLELDKGCRITVPDKMGIQVIYSLQKESLLKTRAAKKSKEPGKE